MTCNGYPGTTTTGATSTLKGLHNVVMWFRNPVGVSLVSRPIKPRVAARAATLGYHAQSLRDKNLRDCRRDCDPEGRLAIAQRFIAVVEGTPKPIPSRRDGRTVAIDFRPSLRDFPRRIGHPRDPAVNCWAIVDCPCGTKLCQLKLRPRLDSHFSAASVPFR